MSSGSSKTSRGGKEDQNDDRTSSGDKDPTGIKSELDLFRVEFRELIAMESAKNEDRFERRLEQTKMEINSRLDLLIATLNRSKNVSPLEAKTPEPKEFVYKEPESVKLSVHFDDDITSEKSEEEPRVRRQERLSLSFKNAVDMQRTMDSNVTRIEYAKRTPDTSRLYLGTLTERDIVEWLTRWDEIISEDPTYPFNVASTISRFVKQKLVTENDINGGLYDVNRAGLPQLIRWLCTCIRPIDNISFIKALDSNVHFRSKKDFILTEKNHRDFYENIKTFNRDFTFLLDLLMDSLLDGQEHPPVNTKEGIGILWVYLKKFPCDYGHAVWVDMTGDKKFRKFSDFLIEFMKVCQKHRMYSENTQKLSHVVGFRKGKGGNSGGDFNNHTKQYEYHAPKRYADQGHRRPDDRQTSRLAMLADKQLQRTSDDDGNEEEYYVDVPPEDTAEFVIERYEDFPRDSSPSYEEENMKHKEANNGQGDDQENLRLQTFMQGPNRFGPRPSISSGHATAPANGTLPMRRPPAVPGVCFEVLKNGTCEAKAMGRCIYDHSAAALESHIKKQSDNKNAYLAKNASGVGESKPRA
jgi:hypothetical protein